MVLGRDLRLRRFTPAAGRLFDLAGSDLGRPACDLHPSIGSPQLALDVAAVLDRRAAQEREVQARDGRRLRLSVRPYAAAEGQVDAAVLTFVDVRALEGTSEAHLRRLAAVVRDSDDAVLLLDLQGRVVDWNHGAERLYGWSREEALRLVASDLAPPELRDELRTLVARHALGAAARRSLETRRLTRDGRVLDVSLTVTLVRDDAGAVVGLATTERDITEHKRAGDALREADRQKDRFISVLAHELRNPLSAITYGLIALRRLLEEDDTRPARGTLARLDHQAEVLTRLVDDLLDTSRIARGELQLALEPVDLVATARHALNAATPLLEARGQTSEVALAAEQV